MSLARNATYNLIGQFLPIPIALLTIPLYLSVVGPERYGVLAIAWVLLGYFGIFDLGLSRATTYRIAALHRSTSHKRARVLWSAIVANMAFGMIGALLLFGAASYYFIDMFEIDAALRREIQSAASILAFSVPIAMLTNVFMAALQAREKFLELNIISASSTSLFQLIPLGVAWVVGPELPLVLLSAVAVRFAGMLVLWLRCRFHILNGYAPSFHVGELKQLLGFGGWVTVSSVVGPFMVVADRFVIGAISGAQAVTNYSIPFQLAQRTGILPSAIASALFPRLSAQGTSPISNDLARHATLATAALLTPIILVAILLIEPFFALWLGERLPPVAVTIGQILLFGFWINGLAQTPFTVIHARSQPKLTALTHVGELLPYAVALYFLGIHYGVIGVAIAFSLRCLLDYAILSRIAFGQYLIDYRLVLLAASLLLCFFATQSELGMVARLLSYACLMIGTAFFSAWTMPSSTRAQLLNLLNAKRAVASPKERY